MSRKGTPNRTTPIKNVNLIKENATVVYHVSEAGEVTELRIDEPRLDVLAVIGPYADHRWNLEEAVLLEVGFGYTRPYAEVHIPPSMRKLGEPQNFIPRFPGFQISEQQYRAVAPYIFRYLQERALAQVMSREDGWRTYKVKALGEKNSGQKLRKTVLTKKGRLAEVNLAYEKPPMVRFSAFLHDQFLVNDLYWAELYGNTSVKEQLTGLSSEMRSLLDRANRRYKNTPKSWMQSGDFANAVIKLDRFVTAWGDDVRDRSYIQKILLRDYLDERHYFFDELAARIRWSGEPIQEDILAKSALSEPETRVLGTQLRIWRTFREYLSFDLYPQKPSKVEEEVPF